MFTGIITDIGVVRSIVPEGANQRITIATGYDTSGITHGASIACDGVCLTVTATAPGLFSVDASPETLAVTTVRYWQPDHHLNLERALKLGDELGGHLVSGHVDGLGQIHRIEPMGGSWRFTIEAPQALMPLIAKKGSVALEGISLTVNDVTDNNFNVMIIPHTWEHTTLKHKQAADAVNLEIDPLARYIERQLKWMKP
jgi:riboflavin synthase